MKLRCLTPLFLVLATTTLLHATDASESFAPLPFDLKPDDNLAESKNWLSLNDSAGIQAVRQDKAIVLMMAHDARFRSTDVAAYPEELKLTATWQITNEQGAMGFGWIDFSTNIYYYLYEDLSTNELILQRGDGVSTKQLALHPLPAVSTPRQFTLLRTTPTRDQVQIQILVNGEALGEAVIDRPEPYAGSTFQIYVGSGNSAEVTLHEISTIPATSKTRSGGGWFW